MMRNVSTAPTWTAVFCTVSDSQIIYLLDICKEDGYKFNMFTWVKPDLYGKSHAGGNRMAPASEHIIAVYKFESGASSTDLGNHFALRLRQARIILDSKVSALILYLIFEPFFLTRLLSTGGESS
jgi:hypothetical protein